MWKHFNSLCLAMLMLFACSTSFAATPLLQEGKKTLYQRVVTHPGASILQKPAQGSQAVQSDLKPFSVYYVFARQDEWLQIGTISGPPIGWIEKSKATDWNQSLTLLFTPRSGRDPVLFFRDEKSLTELCSAADMENRLANMHTTIAKDPTKIETLPVLASEPSDASGAVAADRFYIMPILDMKDPFEGVKFLEVASIDPGYIPSKDDSTKALKPRTAIAVVIDTTISMKPYIDQSLNVIRYIYDTLEKGNLTEDVAFAVVAFRSSVKAKPGTEYETRIVSDFATATQRHSLEENLANVKQATVSTHSYAENSPLGVKVALDSLNWNDYSTRMLIVISDAGPLPVTDPYSSVKMDMPELADYARTKGVWISALHIKSPSGSKNHKSAEEAYRQLTLLSDKRSNYQSILAPTPKEGAKSFTAAGTALTKGIVDMVRMTKEGKLVTKPKDEAPSSQSLEQDPKMAAENMAAALGYAMQLEYFGKLNDVRAPTVIDSWIADMDLAKLATGYQIPTVEVAVLLTKNQLNDLSQQLSIIIDNAERTKRTDAKDFFQGILSASTHAARDPNSPMPQGQNLAELGVLAEFLEGLPYKSDIMLLREDDWYRMSIGQQTTFINKLKSRLARYEEYDKDRSHWESFGATNPGDWVYRVPLTMLP